jgi:ribosomal protein S15P/S13E
MSNHHHSHKKDYASKFKQRGLSSIRRRKLILSYLFKTLMTIAILLFIFVIIAYTID